jgi:hypothetical protein
VLASRLNHPVKPRPVIVEGILLLETLAAIGRVPDYLLFVEETRNVGGHTLATFILPYFGRQKSRERADFVVRWFAKAYEHKAALASLPPLEQSPTSSE